MKYTATKHLKKVAFSTALVALSSQAMAAVPTEATDAITLVGTDGGSIIAAIWVPLATVTVGFVMMKLFKRGVSKI